MVGRGCIVALPFFAFETSSCPCVTCLSDIEGWWVACRWSNLMQLNHSGIRLVCVGLFRSHRSFGSPHRRWVTFCSVHGTRGSHLRHVRMGNEVTPFCGFKGGLVLSTGRKAPLGCGWVLDMWKEMMNSASRKRVRCRTRVVDGRESGIGK